MVVILVLEEGLGGLYDLLEVHEEVEPDVGPVGEQGRPGPHLAERVRLLRPGTNHVCLVYLVHHVLLQVLADFECAPNVGDDVGGLDVLRRALVCGGLVCGECYIP